jgi:WD40 repeat protein
MNLDELRQAIEGPALKQALYFEPPELVGMLIDEVGQMPGALPLLSFTLSELYIKLYDRWTKDKSTDRALRIKDYEELGGVAGALTCRATQEYDNLVRDFGEASGKAYQATMQRVMLRMVTIEGGGVARRRVPESELVYPDAEENKRVAQVSDRLVKARLLVKGQETGEPYVEPAHDFLVRGWDKLQGWKSQEIENLFLQQRLTPQANDWVKYPQNTELLMRDGYRLSALEEILNSNSSWFNQFEAHFVQTSISYRDMPKKAKLIEDTKLDRDERVIKSIHLIGENLDNFPTQIFPEVSSCLYKALETKRFIINKTQYPHSLVFHPNGRLLFVSGSGKRNRIEMINLEDGSSKTLFFDIYDPAYTTGEPGRCQISPDGQKIVAIIVKINLNHPNRYILKMWDLQGNSTNGDGIFLLEKNPYPQDSTLREISTLFAPNSETLAVLIRRKEPFMNQILLLDNQGTLACEPILTESEEVSFSPDGKIIFDDKEQFWDLKGNRIHSSSLSAEFINLIQNPFCEPTYCQTVVSFEDESIKLWDLEGNLIHQFPFTVYQSKQSLALSPDGKLIAIGTRDGKVSIWDLKGNLLAERTVSLNYGVRVIKFSPNGRWIACACENETVQLLRGGNWQFWLQVACDELYNHPTLKNPEQVDGPNKRDIAVSACQVCQKYVWGNTSPQRELDEY